MLNVKLVWAHQQIQVSYLYLTKENRILILGDTKMLNVKLVGTPTDPTVILLPNEGELYYKLVS